MLVVNAYWGGLSFMWNAIHPVVLPAMLAAFVPAGRKNTYLGLLTFAGLIIAMVLQPVAGAVSDRWVSRFGRRRPLMRDRHLFDLVFLSMLGWAGGLTWIFVGYVGLQFSSNTAQGPLQGLLRDRVHPRQLGVASSIKVFLDLLSLVAASLIAGRLMSTGTGRTDRDLPGYWRSVDGNCCGDDPRHAGGAHEDPHSRTQSRQHPGTRTE